LRCADEVQRAMADAYASFPPDRRLVFRIHDARGFAGAALDDHIEPESSHALHRIGRSRHARFTAHRFPRDEDCLSHRLMPSRLGKWSGHGERAPGR